MPLFIPALIISLIWGVGACLRVYRQARYYQIEEYMSLRYLRWTFASRDRWLLSRPLLAWGIGSALQVVFSESGSPLLPFIIGVGAAIFAAMPPAEGEVKKAFRPTPRAKRLVGTAFVLAIILLALLVILLLNVAARVSFTAAPFIVAGLAGLMVLLGAPLWLVLANLLMTPVEATFRRRFIKQAEGVLAEVNPTVIGITGSYGKTTTKTILAYLLNSRYHAYATPKSYNTLMGISLAINNDLAHDRRADYFIAEMGAYIPGEIERLSALTHPSIGIVIDVGPQHLERFGTLENTATAKYELVKALPPDGVAVFNGDNPYIREMIARGYPATRLVVSRQSNTGEPPPETRYLATDEQETLDGLRFRLHDLSTDEVVDIETPLIGAHNVTNILLAAAVAHHEGIALAEIARRARTLQPAESRLVRQTTAQGITIINDAYSANPVGVVSSLQVLGLHTGGKRLLITPGMVELGAMQTDENRKLGQTAARYATDIILVGEKQTAPIRAGLRDADFPDEHVQVVETLGEAVTWYQSHLQPGDTVLFLNDLPDTYST